MTDTRSTAGMMEMPITHQPQKAAMRQSQPVYHESPALALLQPWMLTRLPKVVDPIARQHIIQLAAGIFERQSALVKNIAKASAFQANVKIGQRIASGYADSQFSCISV